ncbi:glycosyl transferase [Vitreoscilla filiformis]|uniref:Glycosyl transferase n=1 Tax=Vitreoscilla filiformis TaxID=63 RepID=A0A221KD91_VITFI|nr:DNA-binding protein YbiB [Vitreoscilla filiformis]ASM76773.1 glycosyl transferase [Vitreoscilla filiformis]
MSIAPYLRDIGRGKEGARSLNRAQAADLMGRLLDGQVSDLEKGAFALAMRIKGETPEELLGFMQAVEPRMLRLVAPGPAVVLPSYNGARKLPNLTPLLACLLAQQGVSVLVHGPLQEAGRVTSAQIFIELGLSPVETAEQAQAQWRQGQPVFMPTSVLHPGLQQHLLALRGVLGLRNPGHTLAKLLPAVANGVRVVNHTHPEYAVSLAEFLGLSQASALLLRGTEGEPVADARRLPALKCFVQGHLDEVLSIEAQGGSLHTLPDLPDGQDARQTAAYIQAITRGTLTPPAPIVRQVRCLQALAERTPL